MAEPIALQLYTLRDAAATDLGRTLDDVARVGFRALELAGLYGVPAPRARSLLDGAGLQAVSAHVPFDDLDARPDAVLAEVAELGCEHVVIASAPGRLQQVDTVERLGARLSELGARSREEGLRLSYHNHGWELETRAASGESVLDLLAAATDPESVGLEVDVYWVRVGGEDPAAFLERHAGRIPLIHAKDIREGRQDAPVGEGTLPWPELISAAEVAGVEWYVVEQDEPADPLRDVATSLAALQRLLAS